MTIHANDLKLRASRVMADVDEGGGGPSAKVIKYGESNTVFDDSDSISHIAGNVSVRQMFAHVDTANTDRLLNAHTFIAKLPEDPNVSVVLAECGPFDRRTQIAQAIANYLIPSVPWNGFLLSNHVKGQPQLEICQRVGTTPPTVGRTLMLVTNEGLVNEKTEFVRVLEVEAPQVVTATDGQGDYLYLSVRCRLANKLENAWPGTDPNRQFLAAAGKTRIRDTSAADASNYHGASVLTQAYVRGPLESAAPRKLHVKSVYGQLVPSSATDTPIADQRPVPQRLLTLATSPRLIQVSAAGHTRRIKIGQENRRSSFSLSLRPLPEAGTLTITWVVLGNKQTITDTGEVVDGVVELTGAGAGTLNVNNGTLQFGLPQLPDVGTAVVVTWGDKVGYTNRSAQGAQVRAPEYTIVLEGDAPMTAASLLIKWMSGGVQRTATASATGVISGDATGRVDPASRTVTLRPNQLPDAGAALTFEYTTASVVVDSFPSSIARPGGGGVMALSQTPVAGTVEMLFATRQTVNGVTSGAVMPTVDSFKQAGSATSSILVPKSEFGNLAGTVYGSGADLSGFYQGADASATTQAGAVDYGRVVGTTDVSGGSANTRVVKYIPNGPVAYVQTETLNRVTDNGSGQFFGGLATINYSGKQVNFLYAKSNTVTSYGTEYEAASSFNSAISGGGSTDNSARGGVYYNNGVDTEVELLPNTLIVIRYRTGSGASVNHTMSFTPPEVVIDLCPATSERIVPNSVRFTWMGEMYEDQDGVLYRERTSTTNGFASGRMNYDSGLALIDSYTVGANPGTITLGSLWTQVGKWRVASLFFMTDQAPVVPGSLTLRGMDVQGNTIEITSDLNGVLTGDHTWGRVNQEFGLGEVMFGDFVDDATLPPEQKSEWWYSPSDVGAVQPGKIWRPWPIDPDSFRLYYTSRSYLPVDPAIIGINPVRLPSDGKVPIYAAGRILCIGHQDSLAPASYSNGQTVSLGRPRVSHVWLIDANGKLIESGYDATEQQLDDGKITIVDTTGWAQPVTVEHRIQDKTLCTDVQIDGTLGINLPLSHDFPVGSVVSSVLVFGHLFARALPVFDQATWDGITWADAPIGNVAPATYNDGANPIVVTNSGALTERYAIRFRNNGTDFDLYGEHQGVIAEGNKNADFNPPNPFNPSVPLMSVKASGWGAGWAAGNVLFPPTVGALAPFVAIRSIQPSRPAGLDMHCDFLAGGDIDRPPSAPV